MFVDRRSARPNRYRVTPENGGEPYYITLERADEPIEEGTPLNAEKLNALMPKPSTAKAGQYIRVSEVDSSGKVTAVEGSDLETWTGGDY